MNLESRLSHGIVLPPGRMVTSDEGDGDLQPLWLSGSPSAADLWAQLRAEHATSGLWPLLLDSPDPHDGDFRPWGCGELSPERMSSPDDHDPEELLARWWRDHTATGEDDVLTAEERLAVTAPFGQTWPGTAPGRTIAADPDAMAAQYARVLLEQNPHARLGLVSAPRGADALTVVGWDGPANYDNDTATFSAVVRDWEERFGARVVGVGCSTLHLSVAAPPSGLDDALAIAAEHFAFCPDSIWQGAHATLDSYAEHLIDLNCWEFWWD
ncbi:DUF4253 domain-containing protein [Streptomyces sp. NBC_00287]|uniref:DUF4253 domain-containing protein n=1 Tax=Streptomyces sp. NBC_00287 TaxID=2975702 RepID=UPI002E2D4902|nr:DUF4253 domain-containing protein [Streptomyces sp. NBC_00287]